MSETLHHEYDTSPTAKIAMQSFLQVAEKYNLLQTFTDANGNEQYYDQTVLDYIAYFADFMNVDDLSHMIDSVGQTADGSHEELLKKLRYEYLHIQEKIQTNTIFDHELHQREMHVIQELGGGPKESTLPSRYKTIKDTHLTDAMLQSPFHETIAQHLMLTTQKTQQSLGEMLTTTQSKISLYGADQLQHIHDVCMGSKTISHFLMHDGLKSHSKKALYALIAQYIVGEGDLTAVEKLIENAGETQDFTHVYVALYSASEKYLMKHYAHHTAVSRQVGLLQRCMQKLVTKDSTQKTDINDIMMSNIYMLPEGVADMLLKIV